MDFLELVLHLQAAVEALGGAMLIFNPQKMKPLSEVVDHRRYTRRLGYFLLLISAFSVSHNWKMFWFYHFIFLGDSLYEWLKNPNEGSLKIGLCYHLVFSSLLSLVWLNE